MSLTLNLNVFLHCFEVINSTACNGAPCYARLVLDFTHIECLLQGRDISKHGSGLPVRAGAEATTGPIFAW